MQTLSLPDSIVHDNDSIGIFKKFNPNFISDFKGYTLGMSVEEIDRLHRFRKAGRFVNSAGEFAAVTGISDSLLQVLSPNFKFPEWVAARKLENHSQSGTSGKSGKQKPIKDLNTASAEELATVKGIGKVLSARIVKFRSALGGFLVDDQLYDVYGLSEEVAGRVLEDFSVLERPDKPKISVNDATAEELRDILYITPELARRIVAYRIRTGKILSLEELLSIEGFPADKIGRIELYLSL